MNNRIKELIKQAYVELPPEPDWDVPYRVLSEEKLVELVIKECMFAVENHGGICGATSSGKIREHFGIGVK